MDLFKRILLVLFLFFILFKIRCKRFKSIMTILYLHYLFLIYFIKFIKILLEILKRYTSTWGVGYFTLLLILTPLNLHITKVITYIHIPLPLRFNWGLGNRGVKITAIEFGYLYDLFVHFLGFYDILFIYCLHLGFTGVSFSIYLLYYHKDLS